MKLKLFATLCTAAVLVGACGDDDGGDVNAPEGEARARIVHIAPAVGDIDLLLDGNILEQDVPYGTDTPYEDVTAGTRNVEVRATGTPTGIILGTVALTDGASHTLLVDGPTSDLRVEVLEDDLDAPDGGFAKLRLIHGAPNAGTVDVYLTEPGADLALETPDIPGADFRDVLDYTQVEEGDYELRVTPTGSLTPVIDEALSLGSGDIRTAIAIEAAAGGPPFQALVLDDTN